MSEQEKQERIMLNDAGGAKAKEIGYGGVSIGTFIHGYHHGYAHRKEELKALDEEQLAEANKTINMFNRTNESLEKVNEKLQEQLVDSKENEKHYVDKCFSLEEQLVAKEKEIETTVKVMQDHINDQDKLINDYENISTNLYNDLLKISTLYDVEFLSLNSFYNKYIKKDDLIIINNIEKFKHSNLTDRIIKHTDLDYRIELNE